MNVKNRMVYGVAIDPKIKSDDLASAFYFELVEYSNVIEHIKRFYCEPDCEFRPKHRIQDLLLYIIPTEKEYKAFINSFVSNAFMYKKEDYENVILEDDDTETGGISHVGETLGEFLEEYANNVPNGSELPVTMYDINRLLKKSGIKEIPLPIRIK